MCSRPLGERQGQASRILRGLQAFFPGRSAGQVGFDFILLSNRISSRPQSANAGCGLQQHLLHAKPSQIAKFSRIFDDSSLQWV